MTIVTNEEKIESLISVIEAMCVVLESLAINPIGDARLKEDSKRAAEAGRRVIAAMTRG